MATTTPTMHRARSSKQTGWLWKITPAGREAITSAEINSKQLAVLVYLISNGETYLSSPMSVRATHLMRKGYVERRIG